MTQTISQLKGRAKDKKGKYRGTAVVRLKEKPDKTVKLELIRNHSLDCVVNFSEDSFNQLFKDMLIQKIPSQEKTLEEATNIQKKIAQTLKQQKTTGFTGGTRKKTGKYTRRREKYGKALPDVLYLIYQHWRGWFNLHDFRPVYNSYYKTGGASRWLNRLEKKEYLQTRKSNEEDLEKEYRLTDQAINKIEWWGQENIISA